MKGTPAIVITPSTRAISHTVLGAISAKFVVSMELRNPREHSSKRIKIELGNRKRKTPSKSKKKNLPIKGTVTGHYLHFIQKTMGEMDHFPEMEGYYMIMDNASIHTAKEIDAMITERGYRCVYLLPYSPELNPIEQFWSIVKNKVKRNHFQNTEDLATRILEAYNIAPREHLRAFVHRSVNAF
ncbi:hypothetical protein RMATCC62417_11334 [Rhizopus microsporus]|nr:hypothetical protein RMATCC62417_11334 [Rhizopus microsporus]